MSITPEKPESIAGAGTHQRSPAETDDNQVTLAQLTDADEEGNMLAEAPVEELSVPEYGSDGAEGVLLLAETVAGRSGLAAFFVGGLISIASLATFANGWPLAVSLILFAGSFLVPAYMVIKGRRRSVRAFTPEERAVTIERRRTRYALWGLVIFTGMAAVTLARSGVGSAAGAISLAVPLAIYLLRKR